MTKALFILLLSVATGWCQFIVQVDTINGVIRRPKNFIETNHIATTDWVWSVISSIAPSTNDFTAASNSLYLAIISNGGLVSNGCVAFTMAASNNVYGSIVGNGTIVSNGAVAFTMTTSNTLYGSIVGNGSLVSNGCVAFSMTVSNNLQSLIYTVGANCTNYSQSVTGGLAALSYTIGANATNYSQSVTSGLAASIADKIANKDGLGTNTTFFGTTTNEGALYSVAVLSTAASASNNPAENEFPTAQWVRNLFNNGETWYVSTNEYAAGTNTSSGQVLYEFIATVPNYAASRYYSGLAAGSYIGSVIVTNRFTVLQGPVLVNSYLQMTNGLGNPFITVHPEIYYSYDKTNWYGDWDAGNQSITTGTNLYQWVVSFPKVTATNTDGFYVQRRFKVVTIGGGANPNLVFHVGTNYLTGTNNASHINVGGTFSTSATASDAGGTNARQWGSIWLTNLSTNAVLTNALATGITTNGDAILQASTNYAAATANNVSNWVNAVSNRLDSFSVALTNQGTAILQASTNYAATTANNVSNWVNAVSNRLDSFSVALTNQGNGVLQASTNYAGAAANVVSNWANAISNKYDLVLRVTNIWSTAITNIVMDVDAKELRIMATNSFTLTNFANLQANMGTTAKYLVISVLGCNATAPTITWPTLGGNQFSVRFWTNAWSPVFTTVSNGVCNTYSLKWCGTNCEITCAVFQ